MKVNVSLLMSEFEKINQKIFTKDDILNIIKKLKKITDDETVLVSGDVVVEMKTRTVFLSGERILMSPLVFNVLVYLIERKNKMVSRDEMLEDIWHGSYVGERIIDVQVHALRKLLGKDKILTRKGYGFEWVDND
jgi:two-component system alkaline phosphatase synthesis response regulator PhoP